MRKRLQWDTRLGGVPRLSLISDDELMRLPQEMLKCVAFIGARSKGEYRNFGTTFFLGHPLDERLPGMLTDYAITAKHVIDDIRAASDDGKCYLRLNLKDIGAMPVEMELSDWQFAEDARVDLAIAPIGINFAHLDHLRLLSSTIMPNQFISDDSIGAGTELIFPGLFSSHAGEKRNIPIARTGTIAAILDEHVQTEFGYLRAHLIEARSIGGLSGSPVFVWQVRHDVTDIDPQNSQRRVLVKYFLFGVIHGHFDVQDTLDSADVLLKGVPVKSINKGIALVTPWDEITRLLNHPAIVTEREQITAEALERKSKSLPIPDKA